MSRCRRSSQVRLRRRRNRSATLMRPVGVGMALAAVMGWPMAVLAADPAVETHDNAAVVFTVIVLLFGSMAAGLFFASPLRRSLVKAAEQSTSRVPQAQPASEPTPEGPLPVAPTAAQNAAVATPWSTARPQPDANWNPERRRAP